LAPGDIDGVSTWPGYVDDPPGFSPVGAPELKDALRLAVNWFSGGGETPGQLGAVFNAVAAVAAGFARHVLCFRTVTEASSQTATRRASATGTGGTRVGNRFQWPTTARAPSAAIWIAMFAQRHMHEYGTTREQLGQIPLACRRHAALNPKAVLRDPLTLDDYLNARIVTTPFGLYDCDIPVDGSTAVIVSSADAAGGLRQPPVRIEAIGSALHDRDSWDQRTNLATMAAHDAAHMMWQRTDLRPGDVDVAQLYDGFSFCALSWLEALGFCETGAGGRFVEDGKRIGLDGEIPLNTGGGQLSGGRLHGYGFLHEACLQLRGEAGERQVRAPEVAVVGVGGGPLGGCMLLTRSR
jgi:acetyl-CoA acetyltransferase